MHWYKLSQNISQPIVDEEIETNIGDLPPIDPPDNSGSGDDSAYEPDSNIENKISEWFNKEGFKLFSSDIFEVIMSNVEPDVKVHSPIKNYPTTDNFRVRGDAQIIIQFKIAENNPILSTMEFNIKMGMLNSTLWKYLGIPYEKAMNYLDNGRFMSVVFWAALRSAIRQGSNSCAFWTYNNIDKYLDLLKQRILDTVYGFGFKNSDINTIAIDKNGNPTCGGDVFMNSFNDPTLSLFIDTRQSYRYSISPWSFQQKESTGFDSLTPENQKNVINDLSMIVSDIEETDIVNNLNIEFTTSGKYSPGDRESPPEYPEIYIESIEPSRVSQQFKFDGSEEILSSFSADDLNMILNTIPKDLLKIFRYTQLTTDKVTYPIYGEDNDEEVELEIFMNIVSGNTIENGVELVFDIDGDIKGFG